MSIENLLDSLNENQRAAATFSGTHALVLAGAGTGKTRTIIARAGYLIHSGVPADRIQVLTFTRRSAKEIVERVKIGLGDRAEGLNALIVKINFSFLNDCVVPKNPIYFRQLRCFAISTRLREILDLH